MPGIAPLSVYRKIAESERDTSRGDVARELSIAITHLEDAELRIARANVLASRQHRADATQVLDRATESIADETLGPEVEPTATKED